MSSPRALETIQELDLSGAPVPFDWSPRTRVVFGNQTVNRLGELAGSLAARRVLVVSDPGIVAAGHVDRGIDSLRRASLEVVLFDGARENPTTDHVARGVEVARDFRPDLIVGLGGGSSMDCAKGVNLLHSCGGQIADYWGVDKATGPLLPLIGVPTTAGTGSEMQSFALISDAQTHVKMACGDYRASCAIAVLDPELTLTQPPQVTALTGIDALSHAVETWVSRPRNPVSMMASEQAWQLLTENIGRVLDDPTDLVARGGMQLGAAWAGLAIENSMLGVAHALANPLTARYGTPHGQAIGAVLPAAIRFNGREFGDWYLRLARVLPPEYRREPLSSAEAPEVIADFVGNVVKLAGLAATVSQCGAAREHLVELAGAASKQWTAKFNPRAVSADEMLEIYENAFE